MAAESRECRSAAYSRRHPQQTASHRPDPGDGDGQAGARSIILDLPSRSPARYLWATLIARLFELLPLTCPDCGAETSCNGLE